MSNSTLPLWTWDALVAASGGGADGASGGDISGVSIDTRSIMAGELFVALKDMRDGHEFVSAAFAKGAAAALVQHDYERKAGDGALIRVDDPLKALERIGIAARNRLSDKARVIAVTGSAGKTGTKEMLRAVLAPFGKTHAPEKSFNNHWGVPLTLARMPADTQFAVIEMGMNHAGEIAPLSRMARPHIAVITNVLPVHVGNFDDGEIGVANAKAEIFAGLQAGGTAILPGDNPHYARLAAAACARQAVVLAFGRDANATVRTLSIGEGDGRSTIDADAKGVRVGYVVGAPGRHIAENSLAVVAVLCELGLPLDKGLAPLADTKAPAGRGARSAIRINDGEILLIDESYNANPASMRAALATLASVPRAQFKRRIAVLGDMRELGADAARFHSELKEPVDASGADLVFACGEHMTLLFRQLSKAKHGAWAPSSSDLVPALVAAIRPGDVVMIKGSLGTNMAPLVAAVRALAKTG